MFNEYVKNMKHVNLLTLLTILAFSAVMFSCKPSAQSQLDSVLSEMWHEDEPGGVVLVMKNDSVVFCKGYGLRCLSVSEDCTDADNRIDANTSFNIASCSKQFTAVAILQLAEQGRLSLDDKVVKFFPEYTDSIWKDIEIRHLLSHSSGIPDKRGYLTREQRVNGDELLSVEYLANLHELHFAPGTAYEYINPTFVMLGMIVERVSGMPFTEYMRVNVFEPADMSRTSYFDRDNQSLIPDMAHAYEYGDMTAMSEEHGAERSASKNWYEYDFGEETFFATRPDGGIYTSVNELVKWERALRHSLKNEDGTIVDSVFLKSAMQPQNVITGSVWSDYQNREDTWYGYGWFIEPGKHVIYHTGDNGGFKAYIGRYPARDACVVILANRTDWDRYELKTQIETIFDLIGSN